ncbi:MAG: tripartite tricarboxylate transporter TctB family protein [Piscinibacter sp.]
MNAQRFHAPHLGLGLFMVGLAIALGAGAARFPVDKGYAILGPQVFPFAVAAFVGVVGLLLCAEAVSGGFRRLPEDPPPSPDSRRWAASAWVSGGVAAIALLINVIGFVPAAAVLFCAAARGFGSRRPLRDLAIGVALTLPVFWLFTLGLGLSLPPLINAWL